MSKSAFSSALREGKLLLRQELAAAQQREMIHHHASCRQLMEIARLKRKVRSFFVGLVALTAFSVVLVTAIIIIITIGACK